MNSQLIQRLGSLFVWTETKILFLCALAVGAAAGLGAFLFSWLIHSFGAFAFGNAFAASEIIGRWYVLLLPALGGLMVGPMVTYWAKEAKGHGVPEVMYAVAKRSGKIRPRVAAVKAVASAISIGSGGSAGREGPIVQIGAVIGSTVGQVLRLSPELTRTLVACGAAGGIAATFGTPIAGVLFALEVILRDFAARAFSMVVISAVFASAVSRILLGEGFFFHAPVYKLHHSMEFLLYAGLGLLAAVWAGMFVKVLYATEDYFDALHMPDWLKPAVGGLALGVIGWVLPQVFGTGHEATQAALHNALTLKLLVALSLAKMLATAATLGSGGSGGVFSPSLFIGAMLGGWVGNMYHALFPQWAVSPGAYALVGMGAVFAAATRAPITAVIIVFEMTNDYSIILPVMAAVVVATLVSYAFSESTIYTLKLRRRGIDLEKDPEIHMLDHVAVSAVMQSVVETIPESMPLQDFLYQLPIKKHSGFPVVNDVGALVGVVNPADIHQAVGLAKELGRVVLVADFMRTPPPRVHPTDNLESVLEQIRLTGIDHMPVVSPDQHDRLIGIVTHADILGALTATQEKAL